MVHVFCLTVVSGNPIKMIGIWQEKLYTNRITPALLPHNSKLVQLKRGSPDGCAALTAKTHVCCFYKSLGERKVIPWWCKFAEFANIVCWTLFCPHLVIRANVCKRALFTELNVINRVGLVSVVYNYCTLTRCLSQTNSGCILFGLRILIWANTHT